MPSFYPIGGREKENFIYNFIRPRHFCLLHSGDFSAFGLEMT
jgi:hypothetical protein